MGRPTVFPTGTTIYEPSKCRNGYTVFQAAGNGAVLIDMNGKVVHCWKDLQGMPNKMLPGGYVMGTLGIRDRDAAYQDHEALALVNWNGGVEWTFDHNQEVDDPDTGKHWVARQHHDYQVEGSPVGYYAPGLDPDPNFKKVLLLTHNDVRKPKISPQLLLEDRLIEIDRDGNIIWEWCMLDHFKEFDLTEAQKNVMFRDPNIQNAGVEGEGDIFHVNCASYLGPNHWFDEGDERFKPDNIIMDSREANIMFIIDHESGNVVWSIGPDFTKSRELRVMGCIVGMHHSHMIPKGLLGAGHIMVFDNGGWAGYGLPSQMSRIGMKADRRDGSRVFEFDPITLKIVWQFDAASLGWKAPFGTHYFYSPLVSDAQRLENGNTLIDEGCSGRFLEVTPEGEVVWEYVYPNTGDYLVYRAYRIPYEWVPQLETPKEVAIEPVDNATFQLPGAAPFETAECTVAVAGTKGYGKTAAFCVDSVD